MKSLHESMLDPDLFGQTFADPTFANWRTVAKVLDGLPLERNDSSNFRADRPLHQLHYRPDSPFWSQAIMSDVREKLSGPIASS